MVGLGSGPPKMGLSRIFCRRQGIEKSGICRRGISLPSRLGGLGESREQGEQKLRRFSRLACSENLPTGLYILLALISSFLT